MLCVTRKQMWLSRSSTDRAETLPIHPTVIVYELDGPRTKTEPIQTNTQVAAEISDYFKVPSSLPHRRA
jgi:hypothetical protein